MPAQKREYYLYDGRASGGQGTDDAYPLFAGMTEKEVRKQASMYGQCACYSYAVIDKGDTAELSDERWEWDYWPE